MAETLAQFRSDRTPPPPTNDGCVDAGRDVTADHVTGCDAAADGQSSPVLHQRTGSSGSASISSCSSHETVVSVGAAARQRPETRDDPSSPTEPEVMHDGGCNGDRPVDDVFGSEMTVMSPLVNRWRRRQRAGAAEDDSTSGPLPGWTTKPGTGSRKPDTRSDSNGDSRRGRSTRGYSSDTETFLRTLNNRRETTSGPPVTVSGCAAGQSPSDEYPSWQRDWTTNHLHRTNPPSTSVIKPLEVCRIGIFLQAIGPVSK